MVAELALTRGARDSLIVVSVMWAVGAVVTGLRLLGRCRTDGSEADDVLAALSLILSAAAVGLDAAVFRAGVGYSMDPGLSVYPELEKNIPFILKMTFVFTLIYLWNLAALKLSLLYFYRRIFVHPMRKWIYLVAGLVAVWAVVFTFVIAFSCDPVSEQWNVQRTGKHCMNEVIVLKSFIMVSAVTDVLLMALPVATVWRLQLQRIEQIAIAICFVLGLACIVIGTVRFWQMFVVDLESNITSTTLADLVLCTVELLLAGSCINIPLLRPVYIRWKSQYRSRHVEDSVGHKFSGSRTTNFVPKDRSGNHTAWIELNDKDQETTSISDNSERRLKTKSQIHVSRDWYVHVSRDL